MKNHIATSIVVTVFALFLLGTNSFGQSRGRIVADIPFDFQIGDVTMKAGRYEFESANSQSNPWLLIVRTVGNSEQAKSTIVPTLRSGTVSADREVGISFNRYESTHYLAAVTAPANGMVLRMPRSSSEKQMARRHPEEARVTIRPVSDAGR